MELEAEAFVLAGGRSSRMGQDKALMPLAGRPLLDHALGKFREVSLPARIAGARSDLSPYAPVVADLHPGCGPLSGIEAALAASTQPLNFFLAVDMPLVPPRFITWMLSRAATTGAWVTLPRSNGQPQPLCAVYHKALLPAISAALGAGNYKAMAVVQGAGQPQAIDMFDSEQVVSANHAMLDFSVLPVYRWFHNCNTPEDMAAIENALSLSQ